MSEIAVESLGCFRAKNVIVITAESDIMSGQESTGYCSKKYRLSIAGGISSWDYDRIGKNNEQLSQALLVIKDKLELIFNHDIVEFQLPIEMYQEHLDLDYIDGVFIEEDEEKEAFKKAHFEQYFALLNPDKKCAIASIEKWIPDTSFQLFLSFFVSERISKTATEKLLTHLIEEIKKDDGLSHLLY